MHFDRNFVFQSCVSPIKKGANWHGKRLLYNNLPKNSKFACEFLTTRPLVNMLRSKAGERKILNPFSIPIPEPTPAPTPTICSATEVSMNLAGANTTLQRTTFLMHFLWNFWLLEKKSTNLWEMQCFQCCTITG